MSEMVDRVARALAREDDPEFGESVWDSYVPWARIAIATMREPTEEMVRLAPYPTLYSGRSEGIDPPPHIAWQRMIDVALK